MKKILVLLLCLILVGCGGNEDLTTLDINKTKGIIENKLENMMDINKNLLTDTYELDLSLMDEYAIKQNMNGDLYAIIKTSHKNEVKDDMDEYFEKVKTFNQAYSPERLQLLENRLEKEIGDYLIYIIAEDANEIYNEIIDSME